MPGSLLTGALLTWVLPHPAASKAKAIAAATVSLFMFFPFGGDRCLIVCCFRPLHKVRRNAPTLWSGRMIGFPMFSNERNTALYHIYFEGFVNSSIPRLSTGENG
jgi:hypothetical protein